MNGCHFGLLLDPFGTRDGTRVCQNTGSLFPDLLRDSFTTKHGCTCSGCSGNYIPCSGDPVIPAFSSLQGAGNDVHLRLFPVKLPHGPVHPLVSPPSAFNPDAGVRDTDRAGEDCTRQDTPEKSYRILISARKRPAREASRMSITPGKGAVC